MQFFLLGSFFFISMALNAQVPRPRVLFNWEDGCGVMLTYYRDDYRPAITIYSNFNESRSRRATEVIESSEGEADVTTLSIGAPAFRIVKHLGEGGAYYSLEKGHGSRAFEVVCENMSSVEYANFLKHMTFSKS